MADLLDDEDDKPSFGRRLVDILQGAAEGYGQGAGNGDFAEAAFARGFAGGAERGKRFNAEERESRKKKRISDALKTYKNSPEFASAPESERVLYDVAPTEVLSARMKADLEARKPRDTEFLDEATTKAVYEKLGMDSPAGARISKTSAEKLISLAGLEDRRTQAEQRKKEREAAEGEKTSRNVDLQVQKFSKNIEDLGVPEAITKLKPLAELVKASGDDIPGVGVGGGLRPTVFGLAGKEGSKVRQLVAGLQNITIKDRSGANVTAPEFVRFKEEFGGGKFKTEQQFRQGLQQALNSYRERLRNAYAGYRPEIRGQYYGNKEIDDYLKTLDSLSFLDITPQSASATGAPPASSAPVALQGSKGSRLEELRRKREEGTLQ